MPPLLSLDAVLRQADIISLHVPLTEETRGLIGEDTLGVVKEGAILVNTSRGPLVDLDSLSNALETGRLSAAALDVFDIEPVDPGRLEGIPNLIATPHMAYYSEEALQESQRKAATQVIKVLTGREPDYQVN
jgi:D-3-phosphoglycerate dehydrogenase